MMTGQILSGVSPLVAINYQIAIMLGIVGSVSLSVITFYIWDTEISLTQEINFIPDLNEKQVRPLSVGKIR